MSEQEQRLTREAEFNKNLSGELLTNALGFCDYMDAVSGWEHAGEGVCFPVTSPGNFYIFVCGPDSSVINNDAVDFPISDEMREFTWAHASKCAYVRSGGKECGCSEKRWRNFTIFGKYYENLCYCCICFMNPDADKFEKMKEWAGAWKLCIDAAKQAAV